MGQEGALSWGGEGEEVCLRYTEGVACGSRGGGMAGGQDPELGVETKPSPEPTNRGASDSFWWV